MYGPLSTSAAARDGQRASSIVVRSMRSSGPDEQQLRRKTQGDVLQRLIKIIEEHPEWLSPSTKPGSCYFFWKFWSAR